MPKQNSLPHEGHRERLRTRFIDRPDALSREETLELLLSYAIPRRNVALLAKDLLTRYHSIQHIVSVPFEELVEFPGLGEATAAYLKLIGDVMRKNPTDQPQLPVFALEPDAPRASRANPRQERSMRVFANDEVANSLRFLPKAASFGSLPEYQEYLEAELPYNSIETRRRRARYFIDRYFPAGQWDTPLRSFLLSSKSQEGLQPITFYHILKSEPAAAKIAEELIYPALPVGQVDRDRLREFALTFLPDASASSIKNMLLSIFYTYSLLGVGTTSGDLLRFRLHKGNLEAFAYVFSSEFPQPGIYSYETLYQGPAHRWLLWDKEWIRRQLYNLRDFGILSKISEIDTVHQFTVALDQKAALSRFFEFLAQKPEGLRDDDEEPPYITP
ncbi:MAG: hypothetical protein PHQ40_03510 [Anaerolineaceae bacterium]|nr:hypothetical protein [Anaerolineaceae bacterium]